MDYRELNKVTIADEYPLPIHDEIVQKLEGMRYFSEFDMANFYWQIPLDSESRSLTAFSPGKGYGLFEFNVLPFGVRGAVPSAQRRMDIILQDCRAFADVYLDNVTVFSRTQEEHVKHCKIVLEIFRKHKLCLRPEKCLVFQEQLVHCGYLLTRDGWKPDHSKVDAVMKMNVEHTTKGVKTFIGSVGYYRRFIKGYTELIEPLHNFALHSPSQKWGKDQDECVSQIKLILSSNLILAYPSCSDELIVSTDASDVGLGAVLSRKKDGRVVEYASRKLSEIEKTYSTTEKEALAIYWALLTKFRKYLMGKHFTVITDHKPLLSWLNGHKESTNRKLDRWGIRLTEFDFEIQFSPGKYNFVPDALSRCLAIKLQPIISLDELREAQLNDNRINKLRLCLSNNNACQTMLPEWKKYMSDIKVSDNIVYRKRVRPTDLKEELLPIIPESMKSKVLDVFHNSSGHQGVHKTLRTLNENVFWVGMSEYVKTFVESCQACQRAKHPQAKQFSRGHVQCSKPWEILSVDILTIDHKKLLVCQDFFTRYPYAIKIPDERAETVTTALFDHIFSERGAPEVIISDQGRNFESKIFHSMCERLGIYKKRTTAYHPQPNKVERFNRSLLQMIRCYKNSLSQTWWERIQDFVYCYRVTPHTLTGISPFEAVNGYPPPSPFVKKFRSSYYSIRDYIDDTNLRLFKIQEIIDRQNVEYRQTQDKRFTAIPRARFQVGDMVWLRNQPTSKTDPLWKGPYKVKNQVNDSNLVLQTQGKDLVVNVDNVRRATRVFDRDTINQSNNCIPYADPMPWGVNEFEDDVQPNFNRKVIDRPELGERPIHTVTRQGRAVRIPNRYGTRF